MSKRTWAYGTGLTITQANHVTHSDGAYIRAWHKSPWNRLYARSIFDQGELAAYLVPNIAVITGAGKKVGCRVIWTHRLGVPAGFTTDSRLGDGNTYIDWTKDANIVKFLEYEKILAADAGVGPHIDFWDAMVCYGYLGEANFFTHKEDLDRHIPMSVRIEINKDMLTEQYKIWGKLLMCNLGGGTAFSDSYLPHTQTVGIRAYRQDSFGIETIGKMYKRVMETMGTTFTGNGANTAVSSATYDALLMEISGGSSACTNWASMGIDFNKMFGPGGECQRLRVTMIGDMGNTLATCTPFFHSTVAAMDSAFYAYSLPGTPTFNRYTYTFSDTSTHSHNRPIVAWHWTFGDGNESFEKNPTHQYVASGAYNVTLISTDDLGNNDSQTTGINTSACPF